MDEQAKPEWMSALEAEAKEIAHRLWEQEKQNGNALKVGSMCATAAPIPMEALLVYGGAIAGLMAAVQKASFMHGVISMLLYEVEQLAVQPN